MGKPRSPKGRAKLAHQRLAAEYEAVVELDHRNPFELLVATILSAQCTDARVNMVTPALFDRYPSAQALAGAMGPPSLDDLANFDFSDDGFEDPLGIAQSWEEKHGRKAPRGGEGGEGQSEGGTP